MHKSSRPLGQTLLQHPHQEERVADHIALPQPLGLYEEPRQPLEAIVGEEARSPAQLRKHRSPPSEGGRLDRMFGATEACISRHRA